MSEEQGAARLDGTVEDIRFRNEQNGYTVLEIARMLHRPDKTVHTQLYRARALLRQGLCGAA